jgi:hypothetical protein
VQAALRGTCLVTAANSGAARHLLRRTSAAAAAAAICTATLHTLCSAALLRKHVHVACRCVLRACGSAAASPHYPISFKFSESTIVQACSSMLHEPTGPACTVVRLPGAPEMRMVVHGHGGCCVHGLQCSSSWLQPANTHRQARFASWARPLLCAVCCCLWLRWYLHADGAVSADTTMCVNDDVRCCAAAAITPCVGQTHGGLVLAC